jgi:hypothetical protein
MLTEPAIRSGLGVFALGASLLIAACASEPKPRPARLDPANPAAAESPPLAVNSFAGGGRTPDASAATPEPPAAAEASHGEHQHGAASPSETGAKDQPTGGSDKKATTYTCPMHPEVVSDKPGRCPKCGMNLVPKTEESPPKGKK